MIARKIAFGLLFAFLMACNALGATSTESIVARDAAITAAAESGYDDCAIAASDCTFEESLTLLRKELTITQMAAANIPAEDQQAFLTEVNLVIGGGDFFQARGNDYLEDGELSLSTAAIYLYTEVFSWTYHHDREEFADAIAAAGSAITQAGVAASEFANALADFATANAYYYSARAMLVDWGNQI